MFVIAVSLLFTLFVMISYIFIVFHYSTLFLKVGLKNSRSNRRCRKTGFELCGLYETAFCGIFHDSCVDKMITVLIFYYGLTSLRSNRLISDAKFNFFLIIKIFQIVRKTNNYSLLKWWLALNSIVDVLYLFILYK